MQECAYLVGVRLAECDHAYGRAVNGRPLVRPCIVVLVVGVFSFILSGGGLGIYDAGELAVAGGAAYEVADAGGDAYAEQSPGEGKYGG